MTQHVPLSPAERRLCAITEDGVLLYDAAKKGDIAIFEVRRRLEAALGRTAETRPVPILDIDRVNATGAPVQAPSVRGRSDIEDLSRRILEDAALLEASDIHLSVDHRSRLGKVTLRVRGKLTHPVHELRSDECYRLLNLMFARLDEGPQTLRENRNQSGAILHPDKLPPGVGGARIQTVWPGNGFHLNIRLRYSQSTLGLASLDDLGLPESVVTDLRYMSTAARGLVLVSGPTESGKSTILATLTREIFHAAGGLLTIASAEDPVEEWHDHLLQIPVNTDELGDDAWIEAQKLFTRIAPDIGQVGEIRTGEAAERAYSFADTGKLTLATIHVSSALDIPFRLMSGLGISPSRALDPAQNPAWTSQRLVPVLCRSCRIPETETRASLHPSREAIRARFLDHGFDLSGACTRGPGCADCDPRARTGLSRGGTPGLAGRQLVLEAVIPDSELSRRLDAGDRAAARRHWIRSGGLPLSVQTWKLVQSGLVDIGDYRHHIGGPDALAHDQRDHEASGDPEPGVRVAGLEPLVFFPPGAAQTAVPRAADRPARPGRPGTGESGAPAQAEDPPAPAGGTAPQGAPLRPRRSGRRKADAGPPEPGATDPGGSEAGSRQVAGHEVAGQEATGPEAARPGAAGSDAAGSGTPAADTGPARPKNTSRAGARRGAAGAAAPDPAGADPQPRASRTPPSRTAGSRTSGSRTSRPRTSTSRKDPSGPSGAAPRRAGARATGRGDGADAAERTPDTSATAPGGPAATRAAPAGPARGDAPAAEPPVTEPRVTEPPVPEPPDTDLPATEPSATDLPATEPAVTDRIGTGPSVTVPPTGEPRAADPAADPAPSPATSRKRAGDPAPHAPAPRGSGRAPSTGPAADTGGGPDRPRGPQTPGPATLSSAPPPGSAASGASRGGLPQPGPGSEPGTDPDAPLPPEPLPSSSGGAGTRPGRPVRTPGAPSTRRAGGARTGEGGE